MRQAIDVDFLWPRARRRTRLEFEIDGQPAPGLPQDCPFTLDELTDGQADPRALAARLAARIAGEAGA
jgi:hypothetical protein